MVDIDSLLARADAAVVVPDSEIAEPRRGVLLKTVLDLLGDRVRLGRMAACARRLAQPDAAAHVVTVLEMIRRD